LATSIVFDTRFRIAPRVPTTLISTIEDLHKVRVRVRARVRVRLT